MNDYDSGFRESRFPWIPALIIVGIAAGGVCAYYLSRSKQAAANVTAVEGRLTMEDDDVGKRTMTTFVRRPNREVWFRVTLNNAPVGSKLDLVCDWIDPKGRVVHQNRYTTLEIDKSAWPTHA